MKIIFISDWFGNPYKQLLSKHLIEQNCQVEEFKNEFLLIHRILRTRQKPQILHFQTIHCFIVARNSLFSWLKFLIFSIQLIWLKLLGIKIIWTVHEWHDKVSKNKQKNISPWQAKILGTLLDAIITHCDSIKKLIEQELKLENSTKVFVVPHGNYINWYPNQVTLIQARKILNLKSEQFVFLIFGGVHYGKGILEAIAAFKRLPQKDIQLVIAGKNGSDKLKTKILQEIQDYQNIKLIAPDCGVPDLEVQNYLNACNCLLLPYKIFTTSGVALLGMSFGKACLAPNAGFFKDVFQNGGALLYNPEQIDGLLKSMKMVIQEKDMLSAMETRNLQLAQQWNWDFVAEQTIKVYKECLLQ